MRLDPLSSVHGRVRVPGDKSIGHRSLLFAAIADGTSRITGLPDGGDVATTRRLLEQLGVPITGATTVEVHGRGWASLDAADPVLDCGNSGTTTRLLLGLLAARRGAYTLTGDASLSRRPMGRVVRPLASLGARIEGGDTLPLVVRGGPLRGAEVSTGVASAQVKSALLLAALQAEGASRVSEPTPTRDHSERMLASMGALLREADGAWVVDGGAPALRPFTLAVPGDPSSAAFFVALAAARPGSRLVVERVCLNPRRTGFLRLVERMGGQLVTTIMSTDPEPVGDIEVIGGSLRGITVTGADIADAIDELPVFAVLAAVADGETVITGASELRVKESDRIRSTVQLLRAFGAAAEELPDGLVVQGSADLRGAAFDAGHDHRIAMSAAVAASLASGPSSLAGHEWAAISYPAFFADLAAVAR